MRLSILWIASALVGQVAHATGFEGCYVRTDTVSYWELEKETRIQVKSHLGLRQRVADLLDFEIEVVGTQGHICDATGVVEKRSQGGREYLEMLPEYEAEESTADRSQQCVMRIVLSANYFRIEAAEPSCSEHYLCGQGVGLNAVRFKRTSKVGDPAQKPCFSRGP
jgi:hypothetical protein